MMSKSAKKNKQMLKTTTAKNKTQKQKQRIISTYLYLIVQNVDSDSDWIKNNGLSQLSYRRCSGETLQTQYKKSEKTVL